MVGDSNVLFFRNRLADAPGYFAKPFALLTKSLFALRAADAFPEGRLHPEIAGLFANEHLPLEGRTPADPTETLLLHADRPRRAHDIVHVNDEAVALLVLGTGDIVSILAKLGPNYDFWIEDPRFVESAFPAFPALGLSPRNFVDEAIAEAFAPLGPTIAAIRALGVRQLYVHSIHPPTPDDDRFLRIRAVACAARVRYKVAILANLEMKRIAEANGAHFLDLWDDFTAGGIARPHLFFDGEHFGSEAAERSIEALLDDVLLHREAPLDHLPWART